MREICFQKEMRDREAVADPEHRKQDGEIIGANKNGFPVYSPVDYTIEPIGAKEATAFIKRYEWLGTPGHPVARYCARNEFGEVAAVALFGLPNVQSAGLCRELTPEKIGFTATADDLAYFNKVACLERGACAHWAHPHTGSWFIPRVLQLAHDEHGWEIFYAYSDEEAGEIGTIYQACNWLYLGHGATRRKRLREKPEPRWSFRHPTLTRGQWRTSRSFYSRKLNMKDHVGVINGEVVGPGEWERKDTIAKHKYVQFVGDKATRRKWLKALRHPTLPYPKRRIA